MNSTTVNEIGRRDFARMAFGTLGAALVDPAAAAAQKVTPGIKHDMWKIMKALRDVNYDGIVILDHSPMMVGGNYTQTAYGFAYMKALLSRANAEAKG